MISFDQLRQLIIDYGVPTAASCFVLWLLYRGMVMRRADEKEQNSVLVESVKGTVAIQATLVEQFKLMRETFDRNNQTQENLITVLKGLSSNVHDTKDKVQGLEAAFTSRTTALEQSINTLKGKSDEADRIILQRLVLLANNLERKLAEGISHIELQTAETVAKAIEGSNSATISMIGDRITPIANQIDRILSILGTSAEEMEKTISELRNLSTSCRQITLLEKLEIQPEKPLIADDSAKISDDSAKKINGLAKSADDLATLIIGK